MAEALIETPAGFDKLSKAEQLRYLQALWDQISEQPEEIPVPESHLQLVENRLRHYQDNPSTARSAFEVIDRLGEYMATAKDHIAEIIKRQPDDSSYDEIIRELAFDLMVQRGLTDSEDGRTIRNEEMERRIKTWQN